jgi:shikimate kinase
VLRTLLEQRAPLYAEVATVVVPTNGRTPDDVVADVLSALPAGTAR